MTKTYSLMRQATYFKAGRELLKIAGCVLDDTFTTSDERVTEATARWAIQTARNTAKQGHALIDLGHEQCVASQHGNTMNSKAMYVYSQAIDRFEKRVASKLNDAGTLGQWPTGFSVVAWCGADSQ